MIDAEYAHCIHSLHNSSFLWQKGFCRLCGLFCLVDTKKVVEAIGTVTGALTVFPYIMSEQHTAHAVVDSLSCL